ncbi:MAG: hypothetical protein HRK26_02830 [Rickettsiaceae bacterium H1]|nr:hypothetical protein [Rickettsiaceae bacterium H1]
MFKKHKINIENTKQSSKDSLLDKTIICSGLLTISVLSTTLALNQAALSIFFLTIFSLNVLLIALTNNKANKPQTSITEPLTNGQQITYKTKNVKNVYAKFV